MAAGLGFKTFTTGEVLTAGDVNGYLMQGILVFASTAARDAAITAPQEGQFAFTKDTNGLWYYDGAAWVASGATGDIEGVTAGVGISGGGTSGTVTITNSMATAIDAKGDLVPGTGADTFARLAVGANDTVLTADSTTATGLKWATPASGGGMTLIETLALTSGSSVTSSTIAGTYTDLQIIIRDSYSNNGSAYSMRLNGDTGSNYFHYYIRNDSGTISGATPATGTDIALNGATATSGGYKNVYYGDIHIPRYSGSNYKSVFQTNYMGAYPGFYLRYALWDNTAAITSITIKCDGGNFAAGNAYIYGVK